MKNAELNQVPILFPYAPAEFWEQLRYVIREEINQAKKSKNDLTGISGVAGLTEKPLYRIDEICLLFEISRPTVYEWIRDGKLRRIKIRSRVYFLASDVKQLLQPG